MSVCWREGLKRENKNPFSMVSWLSTSYSIVVPWLFSGKMWENEAADKNELSRYKKGIEVSWKWRADVAICRECFAQKLEFL